MMAGASRKDEIIKIFRKYQGMSFGVYADQYDKVATEIERLFKGDNSEKKAEGLPNTEKWLNRNS